MTDEFICVLWYQYVTELCLV